MQADLNVANQSGAGFRADLNNQLLTLGTLSSGAAAPSTTYAYQLWADTTNGVLKQRDSANSAWIELGTLDGLALYSRYLVPQVDNSFLTLAGGRTGGANIDLLGPSHPTSPNNAFYDASQHYFRSLDGLTQYGSFFSNGLDVGAVGTADALINVGANLTGNRYAYIDLIGDTTYSDYGLRIIRSNTGPNTSSNIQHRGTGYLSINAEDAGYVSIGTNGSIRIEVNPTGLTTVNNGLSGAVTRSTAQTTTSGTVKSFSSIPSWVKRLTLHFSGLSLSGTNHLLIRLSSGGSYATTGYTSTSSYVDTGAAPTAANYVSSTIGMVANLGANVNAITGAITFVNITGNTWVATGNFMYDNGMNYVAFATGKVTLSGSLDAIQLQGRLLSSDAVGSDTFDAGTINITYEG
jgi:hypothetical protein